MLVEFILNNALLAMITAGLGVATVVMWSMPGDRALLDPYGAVRLLNDERATLIDLRAKAEYESGHIPRARQVDPDQLADRAKDLARKGPLILVCANGRTSLQQLQKLRAAGIDQAYALKGGLGAWREAGQPLRTRRA